MTLINVVELYSVGFACGIVLSVLSFIIGEIINLAKKMMKGES